MHPEGLGAVGLVAKLRAVLRVKDFRKLWLSMSLSSFGDWLGLLAITATAYSLADSFAAANFALGGVLLFRLLPAIVLGPLAGAFADRFDRRKTMVITDVFRFALFASIPIVDNLVWLFVAQFLIEAFSMFWIPAKDAAVPNMLRKDQLEPANQLSLVTTYGLTPVLAAIVFAVLTTVGGRVPRVLPIDEVDLALYLNALTFLVAAVVIWNLPSISGRRAAGAPPPGFVLQLPQARLLLRRAHAAGPRSRRRHHRGDGRGRRDHRDGAGLRRRARWRRGRVRPALRRRVRRPRPGHRRGPEHRARPRPRAHLRPRRGVAGVMVLLMSWTFTLWLALLLVVLMGFFAGIAYLAGFTLLGTEVQDEIRGRTFAIVQSLVRAALILSLAVVPSASA